MREPKLIIPFGNCFGISSKINENNMCTFWIGILNQLISFFRFDALNADFQNDIIDHFTTEVMLTYEQISC